MPGRGPSLIGVGPAAVEFQVSTGRMPAAGQGAQIDRADPRFTRPRPASSADYIDALGGGPAVPDSTSPAAMWPPVASCSGSTARPATPSAAGGGALSSGKYAPGLEQATDRQIYAAMLTGPQNMPVFGDNQLSSGARRRTSSPTCMNLRNDTDPGGWGLGRLGPVPEGLAIFLIGMVALVFTTLWIAGKS